MQYVSDILYPDLDYLANLTPSPFLCILRAFCFQLAAWTSCAQSL